MSGYTLRTWIARHIRVRQRLEQICASYLLFLMVVTTKHSLEEAARFSGLHKSQFSKMLKFHRHIAVCTLESLSKRQARCLSKSLNAFVTTQLPKQLQNNDLSVYDPSYEHSNSDR